MPIDLASRVENEIERISARIEAEKHRIKQNVANSAALETATLELRALHVRLDELKATLKKSAS